MKKHTIEELNDLKDWFEKQQLPESLQIDKATFSPDLKVTVDILLKQAYICCDNPKMQGGMLLLLKIKAKLEEMQQ